KFGTREELTYFSREEAATLLKASEHLIPFSRDAVKEVFSLAAGHPYFTQCLAGAAFDSAEQEKASHITPEIVRAQFKSAVKRFSSGIFGLWDSLAGADRVVLYLVAVLKAEGTPATMERIRQKAASFNLLPIVEHIGGSMDKLEKYKFIKSNAQKEYELYFEFIGKWVVEEVSLTEIVKLLDRIDE
ncbi:MAG: hypothetical protein GY765_13840, partial [bacterium]|nr:hypothetical protein [bacterium]